MLSLVFVHKKLWLKWVVICDNDVTGTRWQSTTYALPGVVAVIFGVCNTEDRSDQVAMSITLDKRAFDRWNEETSSLPTCLIFFADLQADACHHAAALPNCSLQHATTASLRLAGIDGWVEKKQISGPTVVGRQLCVSGI